MEKSHLVKYNLLLTHKVVKYGSSLCYKCTLKDFRFCLTKKNVFLKCHANALGKFFSPSNIQLHILSCILGHNR